MHFHMDVVILKGLRNRNQEIFCFHTIVNVLIVGQTNDFLIFILILIPLFFLLRSSDYGTTYTKLNLVPGTTIIVNSFFICPTNKKKVGR